MRQFNPSTDIAIAWNESDAFIFGTADYTTATEIPEGLYRAYAEIYEIDTDREPGLEEEWYRGRITKEKTDKSAYLMVSEKEIAQGETTFQICYVPEFANAVCDLTFKNCTPQSVWVVKSVNLCEDTLMADDRGVGVFPTYGEAKACFDKNVADLNELYDESHYQMDSATSEEDEFHAVYRDTSGKRNSDFVAIYECRMGKWN